MKGAVLNPTSAKALRAAREKSAAQQKTA